MKKITLILILIAVFATQSFAYCPIPQWCPTADLHQTLCPGEQIDPIEFPSVIGKTLIIDWWTDGTRIHSFGTPPSGISVSGTTTNNREYSSHPIAISGTPTNPGTYHYTVSNTCGVELLHGSITLNAAPSPTGCDFCTAERNRVSITSASFATAQEWIIPAANGKAQQIWSGPVTSPQCTPRGDFYNGGADPNFNVDCRASTNGSGVHYFSWCAVMKHAAILCPSPWRVPTRQDFINLDILLGGDGENRSVGSGENGFTGTGTNQKYTSTTAGNWGGSRFTAHASLLSGASSRYWSSSERSATNAFSLAYLASNVYPQNDYDKDTGFALRCVRDVP